MFQQDVEKIIGGLEVKVGKIKNEIFVTLTARYMNELGRRMNTSRFVPFYGKRTKNGMKFETMARGFEI